MQGTAVPSSRCLLKLQPLVALITTKCQSPQMSVCRPRHCQTTSLWGLCMSGLWSKLLWLYRHFLTWFSMKQQQLNWGVGEYGTAKKPYLVVPIRNKDIERQGESVAGWLIRSQPSSQGPAKGGYHFFLPLPLIHIFTGIRLALYRHPQVTLHTCILCQFPPLVLCLLCLCCSFLLISPSLSSVSIQIFPILQSPTQTYST